MNLWRRVTAAHEEIFVEPLRRSLRKEAQREQDTLRVLVMMDALGVDNPVAYETLDLIPYLVADIHAWHRRLGQDRLGESGVCC